MDKGIDDSPGTDRRIRLSDEGLMLTTTAVYNLPRLGRRPATVETRFGKKRVRSQITVVPVRPYGHRVDYLADVVTGSLYPLAGGLCLSSPGWRLVRSRA